MHKITILYHHPEDPEAFENYYENYHLPLAQNMPGVSRIDFTKFVTTPSGHKPDFYRMAELYFASEAQMIETMGTPEGQATIDDLNNFTGGPVKVLIGTVAII